MACDVLAKAISRVILECSLLAREEELFASFNAT